MSSGRLPEASLAHLSDEDRERLRSVAQELNIRPEDAIWEVLAALEYYRKLFADIPAEIRASVVEITAEMRAVAEGEVEAAAIRVAEAGGTAVSSRQPVPVASPATSFRRRSWRLDWGVVAEATVVLLAIVLTAFYWGQRSGHADAIDEKTAASWAATPDGMKAMHLYQSGELERLLKCNKPGWVVKDNICYPQPDKALQLHGWAVP